MAEITGILKLKTEVQQVTEKFKKREFVLETIEQYPQQILIQLTQDKVSLLDVINEGSEIQVSYNLRGRAHTKDGKTNYYNSIDAWKIQVIKSA